MTSEARVQRPKPVKLRRMILIEIPDGERPVMFWDKTDKFTAIEIKHIQLLLQDTITEGE